MEVFDILFFTNGTTRDEIYARCIEWGAKRVEYYGTDRYRGVSDIVFLNRVFENKQDAVSFLENNFGCMNSTAVMYKVSKKGVSEKTLATINKNIVEYTGRLEKLNKPYYMGVKAKTVRCKGCNTILSTAFCGKSYHNNCPVCGFDLRPQSVLSKVRNSQRMLSELYRDLETYNNQQKSEIKKLGYVLYWAVGCEMK